MRRIVIKFVLLTCCFIGNISLYAEVEADFRDGNMYYKIESLENRECYLLGLVNERVSKLVVPTKVHYNGATFTVVGVWTGYWYGDGGRHYPNPFRNVEEIILPESVKWIEERAFDECPNLRSVQMNGVERIAASAFRFCYGLRNISWGEALKYIGSNAFESCNHLEKIIIPSSCEEIGFAAFSGCQNPKFTIIVQDSHNPLLCEGAFSDCSGQKIHIGRNLWTNKWYDSFLRIEKHNIVCSLGFGGIYGFKDIEYGDEVAEMCPLFMRKGDYEQRKIRTLAIGASINQVPDFSWNNLEISTIYLVSSEPPTLQKDEYGQEGGFSNRTYLNGVLYVPKESISAYKNAPVWRNFLNIQEYE